MRDADIERIQKRIWRTYTLNGKHLYLSDQAIKAVLLSAVELGVLRLNEEAKPVLPYSTEKVI